MQEKYEFLFILCDFYLNPNSVGRTVTLARKVIHNIGMVKKTNVYDEMLMT